MSDPELFKYDVRVRERMLKRGTVTETEIDKHLASLVDAETKSQAIELSQPALSGGHTVASAASDRPTTAVGAHGPASDEDMEAP